MKITAFVLGWSSLRKAADILGLAYVETDGWFWRTFTFAGPTGQLDILKQAWGA